MSTDWLDPAPVQVLYEFDGPRIYTCRDGNGNLFLAYQCGEERGLLRFLMAPFSDSQEWELTNGHTDLRNALTQARGWVFDLDYHWRPLRCWKVDVGNLPTRILPAPGVMLYRHLPALINLLRPRPGAGETTLEPVRSFPAPYFYGTVA
jgi:hypothetical protein